MRDRILIVNDGCDCGESYFRPFKNLGPCERKMSFLKEDPDKIMFVIFTGGADVSPNLYGAKKNPKTYCDPQRDAFEKEIFDLAVAAKVPMVGICRGAQFLSAVAGGKIIQHVENHGGPPHDVLTHDGRKFKVNSYHHQMAFPAESAKILAWANPSRSKRYEGGPGELLHPEKEAEAVWYPHIMALGFQWHPEAMGEETEGHQYIQEMTEEFILARKT